MNAFIKLVFVVGVLFSSIYADPQPQKVKLQLKWFSSFQFAGYYMALEKGFYKEVGLDVTILERDPQKNNIEQVIDGKAEYGVADSSLLLYRAEGKPVQIMASIFQHCPLIFIAHKDSGIVSPYEFKGKRVSYQKGIDDAPLLAMMEESHVSNADYKYVPLDFTSMAFMQGKVDVMSAYLSDQPFLMLEKKIPITIINPLNYGIDFYGDNLFATEKELAENPDRAKRFMEASIRGWHYALENKEETIALLKGKYGAQSSLEHLKYEAEVTEDMMAPSMVDIGYTNPERFYRIGEIYRKLNKINKADIDHALTDLIWDPNEKSKTDKRYLHWILILLSGMGAITIVFVMVSRKLKAIIVKRTRALDEQRNMTDKYVIISATDLNGVITYVSEAFCKISGYSKEELIGQKHKILQTANVSATFYRELWKLLLQNHSWTGEIKNIAKNGNVYWVLTHIEPIFDDKGIKIGYRGIQQNITDKIYADQLAVTDRLTQLYNRSYLDEELHKQISFFRRYDTPMSVILMDIDYFKEVNDLYGHLCGDKVLVEIGQILQNNIRETDTVGRWGGEEFMIICARNDTEQAAQLAEKLRLAIEAYVFACAGLKTASFGVSSIKADDTELDLVQRVDNALYQAKKLGRNRVCIAE